MMLYTSPVALYRACNRRCVQGYVKPQVNKIIESNNLGKNFFDNPAMMQKGRFYINKKCRSSFKMKD